VQIRKDVAYTTTASFRPFDAFIRIAPLEVRFVRISSRSLFHFCSIYVLFTLPPCSTSCPLFACLCSLLRFSIVFSLSLSLSRALSFNLSLSLPISLPPTHTTTTLPLAPRPSCAHRRRISLLCLLPPCSSTLTHPSPNPQLSVFAYAQTEPMHMEKKDNHPLRAGLGPSALLASSHVFLKCNFLVPSMPFRPSNTVPPIQCPYSIATRHGRSLGPQHHTA
jgi:hypothetical protein